MAVGHMRIACWITNATHTHTHTHREFLILIAFPLQQWLHKRASILRHTYFACLIVLLLLLLLLLLLIYLLNLFCV